MTEKKETARKLISVFERLLAQGDSLCEEMRFGAVTGSAERRKDAHARGKLVVFVLTGASRVDYLDASGEKCRAVLVPGTTLYLGKASCTHYFEDSCERVGVSVAGLRLSLSYHDFHKGEAYPRCPDIYLHGNIAGNFELEDLFALLDKRARSPVERDAFTCSIPRMIILALLEYFRQKPTLRPTSVDKLRWEQLNSYLEENFAKPLNREKVAAEFKLSEDHLSRLFLRKTGLTFSQTLLKLRMEHAKAMLQSGDLSVKEVAYTCGYQDFSYFTKVFKKYYKALPKSVISQANEYIVDDLSSHLQH